MTILDHTDLSLCYIQILLHSFSVPTYHFKFNFYNEVIADSCAVIKNNTDYAISPTRFPPTVTSCKTIAQYHTQDIDIKNIVNITVSSPQKFFMLSFNNYTHFPPSLTPSLTPDLFTI